MKPTTHHNPTKPPPPSRELRQLVDGQLANTLTRAEFARLEELLEDDPAARRYYLEVVGNEALLPPVMEKLRGTLPMAGALQSAGGGRSRRHWTAGIAAAACLTLAAGIGALQHFGKSAGEIAAGGASGNTRQDAQASAIVARIESASEAAWAGIAPGGVGSALGAGTLELQSGLAEIRFESGVLLALEAPARLELIDPMRCRMHLGTAVIEVPESGLGFVLETPEGRAVDHGTRFAVTIIEDPSAADFEVLKGRISVHHEKSGATASLAEAEAVRMTMQGIESLNHLPSQNTELLLAPNTQRLRTQGKEACIIYDGRPDAREYLDADLLMVKLGISGLQSAKERRNNTAKHRRSLIGFRLGGINPRDIGRARLVLNLVPTGLGFASSLPEVSTFQIHGVRDDATLEAWCAGPLDWDQAPGSDGWNEGIDESEVQLLGSFDIPRGQTSGTIQFESPELLDFIRADKTGQVDFLLVRATPPLDDWSLVHAFAASTHPTSAGPSLEVKVAPGAGE